MEEGELILSGSTDRSLLPHRHFQGSLTATLEISAIKFNLSPEWPVESIFPSPASGPMFRGNVQLTEKGSWEKVATVIQLTQLLPGLSAKQSCHLATIANTTSACVH